MNVLFLPDDTGVNPYLSELAGGLKRAGHEVAFSEKPLLPLLVGYRDADPDVVHYHWIQKFILAESPVLSVALTLRFFFELVVLRVVSDAAVVWTVHNRRQHAERWPRVERYVKRTFVVLFCDRLVVHCSAAEDAVVEELRLPERVRRRIDVVPHGSYVGVYENSVSETEARERLDLGADERTFLFIGSIRPYKQVDSLVDAFKRADVEGSRLLIAGKPWNEAVRADIESRIGDDDRIDATFDVIPGDEFQVYLNAADAVVLPFREHVLTSGSVVLAMSFGTAVVVPRVGCLPETVPEDGGILYDPTEEEALRAAIETAAEADLDAFGRRCLEATRERDWDSIARRTQSVYGTARNG